jgi:hypothetical protein
MRDMAKWLSCLTSNSVLKIFLRDSSGTDFSLCGFGFAAALIQTQKRTD